MSVHSAGEGIGYGLLNEMFEEHAFAKGEISSSSLNCDYVETLAILEIYEVTYLISVWAA